MQCYQGAETLPIESVQSVLHILEGDVGVHIGRCGRRCVTELLLDLPEVAGLLQQVNGQRVERAESATEYVITRYRKPGLNLRTQLLKTIARAGLQSWPKL